MKTKSEAYKKSEKIRDIGNKEYLKIEANDLSSTVFIKEIGENTYLAKGFSGRSTKPIFFYRYDTKEARNEKIKTFMENMSKHANKTKVKQENLLKVGDVLRSSWGYEQTNIDYYKVKKMIGKTMVEIVEIGQLSEATDNMQGVCSPDENKEIGKALRRKVKGDRVIIQNYTSATKMEPQIIAGIKTYQSSTWSSYH